MYFNFAHPGMILTAGLAGLSGSFTAILIVVLALWSLVWKGFALWHAGRNGQKWWFIALLIVNAAGILEIIYLLWFRADKRKSETASLFAQPPVADEPVSDVPVLEKKDAE